MDYLIQQKISQAQEDLEFFKRQKTEILMLIETMSVMEKNKTMNAPLGGGIYFKSTVESDKFLLNVGAGNLVEKTKDEVIDLLKRRIGEIEKSEQLKLSEINELNSKIIEFQKKLKAEQAKN